jgi:uncharacterized protein with HEPN domain
MTQGPTDPGKTEAVVADILRFGNTAHRIVERGRDAFFDPEDDILRRAARSLIIDIAEAVTRLPEQVKKAHPEIPWQAIRTTRNIVAHAYDEVNDEYVWEALRTGVPELFEKLAGRG